jgi:hypothetical protein
MSDARRTGGDVAAIEEFQPVADLVRVRTETGRVRAPVGGQNAVVLAIKSDI